MPLRTLLGYEPKEARRYDDYGGSFVSYTPARSVTANRKAKYQAPMGRVKKLPPIDEELTPVNTSRPRLNHDGTQARITRLPKKAFAPIDEPELEPFTSSKPVLSVKPIRREKTVDPVDDLKFDTEKLKKMERNYRSTYRPQAGYPKNSPREINHTLVDGMVADYLHYARYGNVLPIYEGTSSSACPCCTDRNKENVRTLLGLPKPGERKNAAPQKYDRQSKLTDLPDMEGLDEDAKMFPNSMYSLEKKKAKQAKELTPQEKRMQKISTQSQKKTWMSYQPLPNATNYLNPEFNRPSVIQELLDVEAERNKYGTASLVVEADSNFDTAMNKLQTLRFGGDSTIPGYYET